MCDDISSGRMYCLYTFLCFVFHIEIVWIIYSYRKVFGRQEWQTMIVIDNDDVKCVRSLSLYPTQIYVILKYKEHKP